MNICRNEPCLIQRSCIMWGNSSNRRIFSARGLLIYTCHTKLPVPQMPPKFAGVQLYPLILGPFRFLKIVNFRIYICENSRFLQKEHHYSLDIQLFQQALFQIVRHRKSSFIPPVRHSGHRPQVIFHIRLGNILLPILLRSINES